MRPLFVLVPLLFLTLPALEAQTVPIRSVPLAQSDQFLLVPSRTAAMGGVSIAVDDPFADPFTNPALGAGLPQVGRAFIAPVFSSVTQDLGHARTIPLGAQFGRGDGAWFSSLALAFQQLSTGDRFTQCCFRLPSVNQLSSGTATNLYAHGTVGRRVSEERELDVGLGVFLANLSAVDGVDLLYPRSLDVDQSGHLVELRLGAAGRTDAGGAWQFVGLHSRLNMTHDVLYNADQGGTVTETGFDRSRTWGLHGEYTRQVREGLRIGGILTGNWKSHPAIPDYELTRIRRDPGTSWAYAVGVGIARENGPATIAADVILQPIWSHTWALAEDPVTRDDGSVIPAGGRTVNNRFQYFNALLRLGVERAMEPVTFAAGLDLYSVNYQLRQNDLVAETRRTQREEWIEWSPALGASVVFPEFTLRYTGRVRTGTGMPGIASVFQTGGRAGGDLAGGSVDFLPAPGAPLTLADALVMTHQVVLTMPLGNQP